MRCIKIARLGGVSEADSRTTQLPKGNAHTDAWLIRSYHQPIIQLVVPGSGPSPGRLSALDRRMRLRHIIKPKRFPDRGVDYSYCNRTEYILNPFPVFAGISA